MDIARPATDSSQSHHPVVLVHQFTSASSAPASDGILAAGLSLVNAASTASAAARWVSVRRTTPPRLPFSSNTGYELSAKPVTIDSRAGRVQSAPQQLKEWGTPLTHEDDLFVLDELDEFISTDFSYLADLTSVKTLHVRESSDEHAFRVPKHRKADEQSLLHIIPQPHIHPSSSTPSSTRIDVPPYRETTPLPIPPYALSPTLSANARTAWLVPIRGKLPWEACTSACVLRSEERVPRPPVPAADNEIVWTHGAVRAFWTYLLDVRTRHGAGAVALSFHGTRAPVQPLSTRTSHDHTSVSAGRHRHHTASPSTPRNSDKPGSFPSVASAAVVGRPQLSAVDYVKVYHAATEAMHLRNLIHLWTYEPPMDAGDRAEIRLLRGAALVLLNERSRGVLIS